MKTLEFINQLRFNGRYSFSIHEAEKALELKKIPALNALHRLKQKKLIVSPAKGFYLILPPEYQAFGCLPADMFVPDLMKYLNLPYYVGFLSAAQFYGAAHQKPQQFQVVTSKNRRSLTCGRVQITFITNKKIDEMPTKQFNTTAGTIRVGAPEVTAVDLVSAPHHGAGINNVATVLAELSESINIRCLTDLIVVRPELFWVQRLGYLFDFLKLKKYADGLYKLLKDKNLHWVRLVSNAPYRNLGRNKKWKIVVNVQVEPD